MPDAKDAQLALFTDQNAKLLQEVRQSADVISALQDQANEAMQQLLNVRIQHKAALRRVTELEHDIATLKKTPTPDQEPKS